MTKRTTIIIMILITAAIIGWDVWLAADGEDGNTISSVLASMPLLPQLVVVFALGVGVGHWFFPNPRA